jgi:hypothetical protein
VDASVVGAVHTAVLVAVLQNREQQSEYEEP